MGSAGDPRDNALAAATSNASATRAEGTQASACSARSNTNYNTNRRPSRPNDEVSTETDELQLQVVLTEGLRPPPWIGHLRRHAGPYRSRGSRAKNVKR